MQSPYSLPFQKGPVLILLPVFMASIGAAAADTRFSPQVDEIASPAQDWEDVRTRLAQMTIEQRVIIRIPMMRRQMPPPSPRAADERGAADSETGATEWVEHKGPKCVKVSQLRAAAITSARGIDLMLVNNDRLRALLDRECGSADLYSGFYIRPSEDGALCAGRDRVLARSGADCGISGLKRLKPGN